MAEAEEEEAVVRLVRRAEEAAAWLPPSEERSGRVAALARAAMQDAVRARPATARAGGVAALAEAHARLAAEARADAARVDAEVEDAVVRLDEALGGLAGAHRDHEARAAERRALVRPLEDGLVGRLVQVAVGVAERLREPCGELERLPPPMDEPEGGGGDEDETDGRLDLVHLARLAERRRARLPDEAAWDDAREPLGPVRELPAGAAAPATDAGFGYLVARVAGVRGDGLLELVPVLDRNRVPLDPAHATALAAPPLCLLSPDENAAARLLPPDEAAAAEADARGRALRVVYQECGPGGESCSPVSVLPAVELARYEVEYDRLTRGLRRVSHRRDGPVLFAGVLDDGAFALWGNASDAPVEIFSRAAGPLAHNVVHVHLDDVRDRVAVDSVNLTGTGRGVDSCREFPRDGSGRALEYRVVVRDGAVAALLHRVGGEVAEAHFCERRLPAPGQLARVRGVGLAVVARLPVGLVVRAPAAAEGEALLECERDARGPPEAGPEPGEWPPEATPCGRRHPEGLGGGAAVLVVADEGGRLVDPPRREAVPVCTIAAARDGDAEAVERLRAGAAGQLEAAVAALEAAVEAALGGGGGSVADASASRAEVLRLQAMPSLAAQAAKLRPRIDRAMRGVRAAAAAARFG